ncbi:hypothetical protein BC829DRAFT_431720 [Chytridium lagenaria]|nr:hypothetical protein BC829DRAFT_431720 [Chytridium lagenaria]
MLSSSALWVAVMTAISIPSSTLAIISGQGSWAIKGGNTGSVCIHAALLPDSKLLCVERPHTQPYNLLNPNTGGYTSTVTDLKPESLTPQVLTDLYSNPFCAGHSQAADGGIWMFGGDRQPSNDSTIGFFLQPGIFGRRKFVPEVGGTGKWENENVHGNLTGGARWYPTIVTLFDDTTIIISGITTNLDFDDLGKNMNPTYEYYPTTETQAKTMNLLVWAYPHVLYPVAFQLPSKKILVMVSNRTITIDKEDNDNTVEIDQLLADGNHEPWIYPNTPTAVLLPMYEETGYKAIVMVCGGVQRVTTLASSQCYSLDADTAGAKWQREPDMPRGRLMPDSVLLPDGTILFTNGLRWGVAGGNAGQSQYAAGPVFETDLFNPVNRTWAPAVGTMRVPRLYHSGAILLEDASVVTMGSEMQNYQDVWGDAEVTDFSAVPFRKPEPPLKPDCWPSGQQACRDPYETRIERYIPPYMASTSRPSILNAPTTVTHNSVIAIELSPSVPISSVSFIRYTTTTHSTNTDQRFLGPKVLFNNGTHVIFRVPPTSAIAPSGNYHLFVVTAEGVPSVARRVLIQRGPATNVEVPSTEGPSGTASVKVTTPTAGASTTTTRNAAGKSVIAEGIVVGFMSILGATVLAALVF